MSSFLGDANVTSLLTWGPRNPSFIDMLSRDCLTLIFKAVKSNFLYDTIPTPRQIHEQNTELVKLRRVRRGWRDLIDSEPYLWNTVAFIMGDRASMESVSMFLHYSRMAIVHLYGCGGSLGSDVSTRKLAHGLKKQLRAASGRIVSFHMANPDPAMLRLWPASAPNLKELNIDTEAHFPGEFCGEMPMLRSVITPVMNNHQFVMIQNITNLTLYPPYTLEKLLAILKNTPMLRKLELRRIFLVARDGFPRVPLPNLEYLCLTSSLHRIIDLLDFPPQTRISVSIPEYLAERIPWDDMPLVSSVFVPPTFARSSILMITTYEARGPTEVRIESRENRGGRMCHIFVGFGKGSSAEHRYDACLFMMGMVHSMISVSDLWFDIQAWSPVKFMPWLKRFSKLKELSLNGRHISPILSDLVSAEVDALSSLERVIMDKASVPIYQEFQDWVASREQAGYKITCDPIPTAGL